MHYKLINLNIDLDFNDLTFRGCYFKNTLLIFTKFHAYNGPITLQFLNNGGVQSLLNNEIIIKVNNGYLAIDELIVENKLISSKEFIKQYKNELLNYELNGENYETN